MTNPDPHHLNPGSVDAVNQGCACPILDNNCGKGLGHNRFWISGDCTLHSSWLPATREEDDDAYRA